MRQNLNGVNQSRDSFIDARRIVLNQVIDDTVEIAGDLGANSIRANVSLRQGTCRRCVRSFTGYPAFEVASHLRPGNGLPRFGDHSVAPICLVEEAVSCLIGLDAIRNRLEDQRMRSHSRPLSDVGEAFFQVVGQANSRCRHDDALRNPDAPQ
jgi:hypothetical protein